MDLFLNYNLAPFAVGKREIMVGCFYTHQSNVKKENFYLKTKQIELSYLEDHRFLSVHEARYPETF